MRRLPLLALLLLPVAAASQQARPLPAPPPAPLGADADTLHGTVVPAPYRWLEALDDPAVRRWAAVQNGRTAFALGDSARRGWFRGRLAAHAAAWDRFERSTVARAPAVIRAERVEGSDRRRAVVDEGNGRVRVLADPGAERAGWSVARVTPSPDGRHVAVQASADGSEWVTTTIVRVADGVALPDTLDGLRWGAPVWTADGRAFFYGWYGRPAPGDRIASRGAALRFHRIGTPVRDDRTLLADPDGDLLYAFQLAPDGRHLFISEGTGAWTEALDQLLARPWLLPIADGEPGSPRPLANDRRAGYRLVGAGPDGALHLLTDRDAPRRRLVAVDPGRPDAEAWRDVVPQGPDLIERVHAWPDRYVLQLLRDASAVVQVRSRSGRLQRTVELPAPSSILAIERGATPDTLRIAAHGFLDPPSWRAVHLGDGGTRIDPVPSSLRGGPYVVTRVRYPSADGTPIPMWIVHRRDLVRDRRHAVWLDGYGASHTPALAGWDERFLAWLESGGIVAVPNLRGGGEFGRDWWEAATLAHKQRTVDDMIAAAEYLVREGYSVPGRIGIRGGSFGGLLVTAVLTQRPDVVGAAVGEVPITDLVRFDLGRHRAQIGDRRDPAQAAALRRLSPTHRLGASGCYPATLLTTAWNDERAPAWMALALTAGLQARQTCDRPILLRADGAGGHGGLESSFIENATDVVMFLATTLAVGWTP